MKRILTRALAIDLPAKRSAFLWGPRKTGKTFWLRQTYPQHVRIDLLQTDLFGEYAARPALLRERYQDHRGMVIIDEVQTRRMIETEKFYLFDVGVANYLSRRTPREGTPEFGKALEHYILMELKAYQAYRNPELDIRYWRTSTGMEVDFVLGEMDVALELKGARRVHEGDLKGLNALLAEHKVKHPLLISLEREPHRLGARIRALPWQAFVRDLWSGAFDV